MVRQFARDVDGPTSTEYAVMFALITIACVAVISVVGTDVAGLFARVDW